MCFRKIQVNGLKFIRVTVNKKNSEYFKDYNSRSSIGFYEIFRDSWAVTALPEYGIRSKFWAVLEL